jgi:hypothetical protein
VAVIPKKVYIRHFGTIRETELVLPKPGLCLVVGHNMTSSGVESIGCHAKGQKVLMFDGTLKQVEDIVVGDFLMGPDSTRRTVLNLIRGHGDMFTITPLRGKPFVVNRDHILAMKISPNRVYKATPEHGLICHKTSRPTGGEVHLSVGEILNRKGKTLTRGILKLFKTGVEFKKNSNVLEIPPRILGMWLGDGDSTRPDLATADKELSDLWRMWASTLGLKFREIPSPSKAVNCRISYGHTWKRGMNTGLVLIRKLGLWKNKHIPHKYKVASRTDRLELLAGLIDTDGSHGKGSLYYVSVNKRLAEDVEFLSNSLGFNATIKPRRVRCQNGGFSDCFLVKIIGDCSAVPCALSRKQALIRSKTRSHPTGARKFKDPLVSGFSITSAAASDYYGFSLDKDQLYLLDDFTVTHNSGKTLLGEAISRTLLGVRGRFEGAGLGAYSSDLCGNKNTLIQLECDLNGQSLTIWSGYKCAELSKSGEGLRFKLGDSDPVERGTIQETREELNRLLGITQPLSEFAIHLDGERLKFNHLSERQLVELFLSALSTPNWEGAQKRVSAELSRSSEEQAGLQSRKELYESSLAQYDDDMKELELKAVEIEDSINLQKKEQEDKISKVEESKKKKESKLSKLKNRRAEIKVELKKIEDANAVTYADLELKFKRAKSAVVEASSVVETATGSVSAEESRVDTASDELLKLKEPDTCPTCGKPWDKKHSVALLESKKKALSDAKATLLEKEKELAKARSKRSDARNSQDEIQAQMKELNLGTATQALSKEYEGIESDEQDLDDQIKDDDRDIADLKKPISDSKLVAVRTRIQTAKQSKKTMQSDLSETNRKLVEVGAFIQLLSYLYKAFGPTGVPNMVLQDCLEYLNRAAGHLSSVLTGDLVEISFSSTKVLATSAEKPCLVINAKNRAGSKKFIGSSKGEAGISNLIISETLYNLGRLWQKVAYRWLDEAVNSQDKTVRGTAYSYYRNQAKQRQQIIFVVDHSPDVEAHADSIILAEKCGSGFTTYRAL